MNKVVYIEFCRHISCNQLINIKEKYIQLCKDNNVVPKECSYLSEELRTDTNFVKVIEELDPKLNKNPKYSIGFISDEYLDCYRILEHNTYYYDEISGFQEEIYEDPIYLIHHLIKNFNLDESSDSECREFIKKIKSKAINNDND